MSTERSDKNWLILVYTLPANQKSLRTSLWRRLKRFGALSLKTSAHLLPDDPIHLERFQWLAQQARDGGGDATLARSAEIDGYDQKSIVELFNQARAVDYRPLGQELLGLDSKTASSRTAEVADSLQRIERRYRAIQEIDFFDSPLGREIGQHVRRLADCAAPPRRVPSEVRPRDYKNRIWLTRPRPEADRVGSAWLIRRFIDPAAEFVFSANPAEYPGAVTYDTVGGDFTHEGELCTFETLVEAFGIHDKAAREIGEMIHDADLEDGKFQRPECIGLHAVLKGWAQEGRSDHEILELGCTCFEALHRATSQGR